MKLIVGLGNPGKEYENTRHNMGFRVIDLFCELANIDCDKEDFHGVFGRKNIFNEDVIVLKPTTFMNLSGQAVKEISSYFKIDVSDIFVVYDDMAIDVGSIRIREKGSSGGHKGIQSIIDQFKTDEIKRIRIGIGEPPYDPVNYVLGKPTKEEEPLINEAIAKAAKALVEFIKVDFQHAASKFN